MDNPQLTADGHWLAYQLKPTSRNGGETSIVLRSTRDSIEYRFDAGASTSNAGQLKLSESGKWAAFLRVSNARRRKDDSASSMVVVGLPSGRTFEVPSVEEFAFDSGAGDWLASKAYVHESTVSRSSYLSVRHLPSGRVERIGNVGEFAFDPTGRYLAWIDLQSDDGGRVHLQELTSGKRIAFDNVGGTRCGRLSWSPSGDKVAMLCGLETAIVVIGGLDDGAVYWRRFNPDAWLGFPSRHRISTDSTVGSRDIPPRAPLTWRSDERGIFFGIREQLEQLSAEKKSVDSAKEPVGSPIIWHWQDSRLPRQKEFDAPTDTVFTYLSYLSLMDGRFVRLADSTLEHVAPHLLGTHVLGYDDRSYRRHANLTGREYRDYYLVDLRDGTRSLIRHRLQLPSSLRLAPAPQLSPDGGSVIYVDGATGKYFARDVATGHEESIAIGLRLYDPRTDQSEVESWAKLRPLQGWSSDGEHALVTDGYDIWALPLRGGRTINLTGDGRQKQIRYTLTRLSIEADVSSSEIVPLVPAPEALVDLNKPMYFRTTYFQTMDTGLAVRLPGEQGVHQLAQESADVRYVKAARASKVLVRRETAVDSPNYYLSDDRWAVGRPLTDTNPQQRDIHWSPGARLLSYTNAIGEPLKAVLHLPVSYSAGQSYPTIVRIYEGQSGKLHRYAAPYEGGGGFRLDIPFWTSQGYAVLMPDIRPRMNRMKNAIVEDIDAAVDAAIASGVVDSERIAVIGHSFGGYEVNVLASHSRRFKIGISLAGISNLFQKYAETRGNGIPQSRLSESGRQPYLPQPWWENWEAYRANSPLFDAPDVSIPLLIMHGRQDDTARFDQSEQFFNVLRRLGKPVVLIEYLGEKHSLADPASVIDATLRQKQLLDHFLKDKPAPEWWEPGSGFH